MNTLNRFFFLCVLFTGLLQLQACTSTTAPVVVISPPSVSIIAAENAAFFGERSRVLSLEELHFLTPVQTKEFLGYMNSPDRSHIKPNRRLFNYLKTITRNFNYEGATYTASQALSLNSGNCLSLAILTTALANIANIEVDYQLIDDVPVFDYQGTVIKKGVHVRSILYDDVNEEQTGPKGLKFWSIRPGLKIDYFPSNRERFVANLNPADYQAMYYRNIAVEALIKSDYNTALWHALESLKYAPDHSAAINILAVINRRTGQLEKAEELYQHGIANAPEKLSLLKNYRILLQLDGRPNEAKLIEDQLEKIDDPSPFNWFQLARSAHEEGEFFRAIRYFNRAIELAPYLHEAHLGLAQAQYEVGRLRDARGSLEQALINVYKVSIQNLYKAKLSSLSKEIYN